MCCITDLLRLAVLRSNLRQCHSGLNFPCAVFCRGTTWKCPAFQRRGCFYWDAQPLQQLQWRHQCSRRRWVQTRCCNTVLLLSFSSPFFLYSYSARSKRTSVSAGGEASEDAAQEDFQFKLKGFIDSTVDKRWNTFWSPHAGSCKPQQNVTLFQIQKYN